MKIQDILSTKFSVKAQQCYRQEKETRMKAQGWVREGTQEYETITTQGDFSHFEYEMQLENSPKTISLTPLRYWQTIDIDTTRIKQQLAYELVNECHLSKSQDKNMSLTIKELIDKSLEQDKNMSLTIKELIDKSLELDSRELDFLAGLFDILSKNKQLDKTEVVQAILSRITDQKLEQLTQEKIKSYSQSVDDYLGVTDAKQKDSFINAINGKREESMQRILFGDRNNNNVSENIELFKTSFMTVLTKEQVVELLLNPSKEDKEIEIDKLNELLPKEDRLPTSETEKYDEEEKKKIINKALDFLGFEKGYLEEEKKPKTSVWGCCAQPSVSNEELVVGRE